VKRPVEPSAEDLRKWRRLIDAARIQARAPLGFAGDLGKRAMTAGRAVIPPAHFVRGSAFQQLVDLGKTFAGLHPDQRPGAAARLDALADQVEAALRIDRPAAPAPARTLRHRADLDG
jgi:hypothetical protein